MKGRSRIKFRRSSARKVADAIRVDAPAPAYRIDPKTGARIPIGVAEMARVQDKAYITIPRSLPLIARIEKPKC